MKQMTLFKNEQPTFHGGQINHGRRKARRPLATKRPLHLVLKCHKDLSLFSKFDEVKYLINKYSFKFHIKIYSLSVQQDHIHFLIKIENRESYKKFSRSLTGVLARKFGKGIWNLSPFTRVVSWGRDYENTKKYISQNEDEIWGVRPYTARKHGDQKYGRV